MNKKRITLDTNILGDEKISQIKDAVQGKELEIAVVTVSDREIEGSKIKPIAVKILETGVWDESQWDNMVWGDSVNESFVLGESKLNSGQLGSEKTVDMFETILKIISSGSFPKAGSRENLAKGEKHQLRDAMILEAHCREKRDVLVSDDTRAFGKRDSKLRQELEELCKTKIMTSEEFCEEAKN